MTESDISGNTSTETGFDPDAVAALWLAEDQQAETLAQIRDQLDVEAKADWLDDAKAKERTRRRIEALRRHRRATQPPPPAAEPQRLDVHHTFGPQPATPASTGARLHFAARLFSFLLPITAIVGAFMILIGSALVLDAPATPDQRARNKVDEHQWRCADAATVEALTIDDDNVLWHWITPIGTCDELTP